MAEDTFLPDRRTVLAGAGAALAVGILSDASRAAVPSSVPIIDTHIHLFDSNRPQGAPYRGPKTERYYTQGAFPEVYRKLVARYHVLGAIEVEASAWTEDNLWVLETSRPSDIMVGTIGNMQPDAPDFAAMIERYAKDPLFRGIRYGNLWGYDLAAKGETVSFLDGVRVLAQADLVLDSANPKLDLLQALVRLSDAVPSLRIVIDHLPHYDPAPAEQVAYRAVLREIGERPQIFVKLSEVIHPIDGVVSTDLKVHLDRLDLLYGTFGEDRVLFGSDWPNILQDTALDNAFAIMRAYFADKSRLQQEKYFWRNSLSAYKWQPRSAAQRALLANPAAS
jgi:L-fuconolactonase